MTLNATRKWETNPSKGYLMLAIYINGTHCGYVESHTAADALVAEIKAAREAAAPVQTAAYMAPRRQPRKAKTTTTSKKSRCGCPACQPGDVVPDEVYFCRADKEHIAIYAGRPIARGGYLATKDALNNHRYQLLRYGHGLDAEQASDVLAAQQTTA